MSLCTKYHLAYRKDQVLTDSCQAFAGHVSAARVAIAAYQLMSHCLCFTFICIPLDMLLYTLARWLIDESKVSVGLPS